MGILRADQAPARQRALVAFLRSAGAEAEDMVQAKAWVAEAIEGGIDLETADAQGRTALMLAAQAGLVFRLLALLNAGANPLATDQDGATARGLAAAAGASWAAMRLGYAETEGRRAERSTVASLAMRVLAIVQALNALKAAGGSDDAWDVMMGALFFADALHVIDSAPNKRMAVKDLKSLPSAYQEALLTAAARRGNAGWTGALLQAGAKGLGMAGLDLPMVEAAGAGGAGWDCIRMLIHAQTQLTLREASEGALTRAAEVGHDFTISQKLDIGWSDDDFMHAAAAATKSGQSMNFIYSLLRFRRRDSQGTEAEFQAFKAAIEARRAGPVVALLHWGANPVENWERNAIAAAAKRGEIKIVSILLRAAEKLLAREPDEAARSQCELCLSDALFAAYSCGQREAAKLLLEAGAQLDPKEVERRFNFVGSAREHGGRATALMLEAQAKPAPRDHALLVKGNQWLAAQWVAGALTDAQWPVGRRQAPEGHRPLPPEGDGERAEKLMAASEAAEAQARGRAGEELTQQQARRLAFKLFGVKRQTLAGPTERLFVAAERNGATLLSLLAEHGVVAPGGQSALSLVDEAGCSLLHRAAMAAAAESGRALLAALDAAPSPQREEMEAVFFATDFAGRTPTHWAALSGCSPLLDELLARRPQDASAVDQAGLDLWGLALASPEAAGAAAFEALIARVDAGAMPEPADLLERCVKSWGRAEFEGEPEDPIARVPAAAHGKLLAALRMLPSSPAQAPDWREARATRLRKELETTKLHHPASRRAAELLLLRLDRGEPGGGAGDAAQLDAALFQASAEGENALAIAKLVADGASVAAADGGRGWEPLHHAIAKNRRENILALREAGASLSSTARRKGQLLGPMALAVAENAPESIAALIALGLPPDGLMDEARQTYLSHAAFNGRPGVVEALLAGGADVNRLAKGLPPLGIAAFVGDPESVSLLLHAGAKTDQPITDAPTALFLPIAGLSKRVANEAKAVAVIEQLLSWGVDPERRNDAGLRAIDLAQEKLGQESPVTGLLAAWMERAELRKTVAAAGGDEPELEATPPPPPRRRRGGPL